MTTAKPDSTVVQILENNGFKFLGFHSLDEASDQSENWQIHSTPFVSVSHTPTGAMWVPFNCQYGLREIKQLLWLSSTKNWKQWRQRDDLWSL
jgi:hypothetical protein